MVYLPRVFENNEKVFSFHYFYLRNKILTLKFLTFFKICIISVINFKTLKVFSKINFRYNKLQYLLFALHRILIVINLHDTFVFNIVTNSNKIDYTVTCLHHLDFFSLGGLESVIMQKKNDINQ